MRKQMIGTATPIMRARMGGHMVLAAALIASAAGFAVPALAAAAAGSGPVLAEIGSHKITQQEVDSRIKIQLYDARKQAVDQMVDDYLLQQAAKKEKLSVADYLKREIDDKVAADVTDASAKKFYDDNKDRIPPLKAAGSYDKVKDRLIPALRERAKQQQHEQLLARLRQQSGVKILLEAPRINLNLSEGGHPTLGSKDAPVTVVEFGDFQCPFCKRSEDSVKAIRGKYGDQVRLVFMDFPLEFHAHAMQAASAARCAGGQGKYWEYHDALFADQSKLGPADLKATAKKLGLDTAKFDACLDKGEYDAAIRKDLDEGHKLDVSGTPTFFIDGRELVGAEPPESFEKIIDEELAKNGEHNKKTASAE